MPAAVPPLYPPALLSSLPIQTFPPQSLCSHPARALLSNPLAFLPLTPMLSERCAALLAENRFNLTISVWAEI